MLFFSFLSAILLHECGHLIGLLWAGAKIVSYRLSPFGITVTHTHLASRRHLFTVAALGPLFSLIGYIATHHSDSFQMFSLISLLLGSFNLLPIPSLDGEKMMKALLFSCPRLRKLVSALALFLLWLVGCYVFWILDGSPSLFLLALTLFCEAYRQKTIDNS
ncbi:MAG: site-2 protease family protein [Clostridia bacterium]|nr:site-2 protease family protein [Clostridia bacterium]